MSIFRTFGEGGGLFHTKVMLLRAKINNSSYKYVMVPNKLRDVTKQNIQWESLHEPHGDYNRVLYVTNDMILGNKQIHTF